VHFDERYRFCGPKRANNVRACNDYFSGWRETATIGPSFSGAPQTTREANGRAINPRKMIVLAVAIIVAIAAGTYFYFHRAPRLTAKDTIVLADFANTTGDPVFDETLAQGFAVQLEQSPFLALISEEQTQQTLKLMGRPSNTKLTPEIAREVCQRTGSAIVLDGSIAQIGAQYSLILKALKCTSGETLTSTEALASDKSHVLDALGKASSEIRAKLGESVGTVKRFDTPLEQATTPSLEALQAFSLGEQTLESGDYAGAAHLFERAVQLDPRFAMAYNNLGVDYNNLGENQRGAEATRQSYELRGHVSELEKLDIEAHYYHYTTGDLDKAIQAYDLWAQTYPRAWVPPNNEAFIYVCLGQNDKALAAAREAMRLLPSSGLVYVTIVQPLVFLNRLDDARGLANEAEAKKLDSAPLRFLLYQIAFLQNDASGMTEQVTWSTGKPGVEDVLLVNESDTAAYSGRVEKGRVLSRRAVASAEQAGEKETAATYEADEALREILFGNAAGARARATAALVRSTGRDVQYGAALALAFAGDAVKARALADDLAKRFPDDTIVRFNYLPTLRAELALAGRDSAKALEGLQAATPYELGAPGTSYNFVALFSVYVRGEAELVAHHGSEAAAEFQKVLDHRGIVCNSPIGALAHLGLARAYAVQGDTPKARAAYQDFLTLWKDADPEIPILRQAKAEYAKLR
jgi:eukaryotic-like serine/threonine-protein kinase